MSRLKLEDSTMDVIVKMAEGNPGAVGCIMNILTKEDWYAGVPGGIVMMHLDDLGIYGSHLYVLVNDCCNQDLDELDKVLRNYQYGMITKKDIQERAMSGRGAPFEGLYSIEALVNGWYLLGNSGDKESVSELRDKQLSEEGRYTSKSDIDFDNGSKITSIVKNGYPYIGGVDYSSGSDYTGITKIDEDGKADTTILRDEKPTNK